MIPEREKVSEDLLNGSILFISIGIVNIDTENNYYMSFKSGIQGALKY